MVFPQSIDTSLTGRMHDIERAFDAGAYLSALSLALTIPDVCGDRLHPNSKSRQRYVEWFNEYVASNYLDRTNYPESGEENTRKYYFDGDDCYQLRCVFLHQGINATDPKKKRTVYNLIQFRVFEEGSGCCDHIGKTTVCRTGEVIRQIDLDLRKFVHCMSLGVEHYIAKHPAADEDNGCGSLFYEPVLDFKTNS